jgi:hypothetical protein
MRNLFKYVAHGLALRTALTVGVQLTDNRIETTQVDNQPIASSGLYVGIK